MKRIGRKSLRYVPAAVLLCLAVLAGIGVAHTVNAAGTSGPTVTYDTKTDTITVKDSSVGYQFYTTAVATKTVPAANKWMKTDAGAVDMSGVTAGGMLYYANSSAPALHEIVAVRVPASPTLVSAVYKPSATAMDEMFVFKSKVPVTITTETTNTKTGKVTTRVSKKTEAVVIPHSRIQIRVNDNAGWTDFDKAITAETLERMRRDSAVIYARVKPSEKTEAGKTVTKLEADADANGVYQLADTGTAQVTIANVITTKKNVKTTKEYDASVLVRYGVSKAIRIARRASGPAVEIDYANHAMTLRKGQSYGEGADTAVDPAKWTDIKATEKMYFGVKGNVTKAEHYAVKATATAKTPDGSLTYLDIPIDTAFADTSSVNISGGFEQNANMKIANNAGTKGVAYQYAIVDLYNEKYDGLIDGELGQFDYGNKNVKWTTVKTGGDGTVNVSFAWAKVKGKQVLVRKAAAGNTFSSKIELLNAPAASLIATYNGTTAPISVGCWTKLTQDLYGKGFRSDNMNIVFCPCVSIYYTGDCSFRIYSCGGQTVADPDNMVVTIGNRDTLIDVLDAEMGVEQKYNYKITGAMLTDLPENHTSKVVFTIPDGYTTANYTSTTNETTAVQSTKQVITVMVNTKKPVIKSAVIKNNNLLLKIDSQVVIGGSLVDTVGQHVANISNVTTSISTSILKLGSPITCEAYNKKTGETVLSIPLMTINKDTVNEKMKVTLRNITNVHKNTFETAFIECDNPTYSK